MTRRQLVILSVIVALGALLRLDFLIANHFVIDSDEAIVGLMAKHILEGKGIPTFYYGQHYMGSFEPLVSALIFAIVGVSSVALKLVPFFFSLVLIVLIYFLAKLCLPKGSENRDILPTLTALFTAIPPSPLVIWSSMARGGFIEIVCIGTWTLILLFKWMRGAEQPLKQLIPIGLLMGFGWWINNQIIFFAIPVTLGCTAVVWRGKDGSLKKLAQGGVIGVLSFFAGGLPFWIYNFTHEFASFGIFNASSGSDFVEHFQGALSTSLPILLGAKRFWGDATIYPQALTIVSIVFGILLFIYLSTRGKKFVELLALKIERDQPLELLFLFILTTVLIFASTSFGSLVEAPRYLLPLYPAIFILSAYSITVLLKYSNVWHIFTGVLLAINLLSSYYGGRAVPGEPFVYNGERASKSHDELIQWLTSRHIKFVRTNYWIGYRLAFETEEAIRFIMFKEPEQKRILAYESEGRKLAEGETPYVLTPSQAKPFQLVKDLGCISFQSVTLSGYTVLYNVKRVHPDVDRDKLRAVPSESLMVKATQMSDKASFAVDGSLETRWGTGEKQSPGMEFHVTYEESKPLALMTIDYGKWKTDFARALQIELVTSKGERKFIREDETRALAFVGEGSDNFSICLPAIPVKEIILRQTGSDTFFDWSIAELKLFVSP